MNDFLELFTKEVNATIRGLGDFDPRVSKKYEHDVNSLKLNSPYLLAQILCQKDLDSEKFLMLIILPIELVVKLTQKMLVSDGTSEREGEEILDEKNMNNIKEMLSNILSGVSQSLVFHQNIPNLRFTLDSMDVMTNPLNTQGFDLAIEFTFSIDSHNSALYMIINNQFYKFLGDKNFEHKLPPNPSTHLTQASLHQDLTPEEIQNIQMLLDVHLNIRVRIGQKRMLLKDVVNIDIGSVIELDTLANDPLEILIEDKVIAKGEVVIVDGNFGIQITEIQSKHQRIEQLKNL